MGALPKSPYVSPEEYLLGENDRPDGQKYEWEPLKTRRIAVVSVGLSTFC